uniref:Torsin-1A-interacting protein 1/2 AAA+ activator domain-containing protein n=1 Tax=Myripristis murdjan TaxID=586833 RepID=A0A667XZU7_9TELE
MAEQDTADLKVGSTQSISLSQDPACDESKLKETDCAGDVTEEQSKVINSDSPPTPADGGAEISGTQGTQPTEVEGRGLDNKPDVEKSCSAEHNDRSHGDHRGNALKPDDFSETIGPQEKTPEPTASKATGIPGEEDHSGKKEGRERSPSPALNDRGDHNGEKTAPDDVDGQEAHVNEEPQSGDDTLTGEREEDSRVVGDVPNLAKDVKNSTASLLKTHGQKHTVKKEKEEQNSGDAQTIGPKEETPKEESTALKATGIPGANVKYWMLVVIVALCSVLLHHLYQSETPPEKKDVRQVDIFLRELEIVKTQFPSQRSELWRRSRIHLARHLQTAQPTEPVSLILTAGTKAEGTLHCLAQALASAFSAALNSSVLHIDGASKANQDSDQVKLDIDSQLRAAFEGDKPVAVVHRFDELPPASTLIFYRYCDHENAAYKKTSLMFTVLLGGEDELPAHLGLSAVEEMVDDQLKKKFLSSSHTIAFDRMDLDKYGGLWSRISHLILPVASEKRIEHDGC